MKEKVREPLQGSSSSVLVAEFEAFPDPKVLTPKELSMLSGRIGNSYRVADYIGASEAFVRLSIKRLKK